MPHWLGHKGALDEYNFGMLIQSPIFLHKKKQKFNTSGDQLVEDLREQRNCALSLLMLWFNFILALNVIFLCFGYGNVYTDEFETKENTI